MVAAVAVVTTIVLTRTTVQTTSRNPRSAKVTMARENV
jgi:hypothetical protein